jgi:hypothetical protein
VFRRNYPHGGEPGWCGSTTSAAQRIKEGKQAMAMMRLSCHRFRANEVRLWLSVLAYNLGNLWRPLAVTQGDRQVVGHQSAAGIGENRFS